MKEINLNQYNELIETDCKPYNINGIREDFPVLKTLVHGKPLVYLDNAATTHKPIQVIDAVNDFYANYNSNIHRGVHKLSQIATDKYEDARRTVKSFINAKRLEEIVFTSGTTDSINLVVSSYGRKFLKEGDNVIISTMEHHSNIVPWQMLREEKNIEIRVIPIDDNGDLMLDEFYKLIDENTKFVSVTHISNALGTVNPIKLIIDKAHETGIPVLIDGAQSIHHTKIDVQQLDCDFFVFSGHKIYGPTGIGILYGKKEFLEKMPPHKGGGDMILSVSFDRTIYNDLPYKFEAGTPNIAGAIGLTAAIKYVESVCIKNIARYENELLIYATNLISNLPGVRIIGNARNKSSVISFVMDNAHPHDIGTLLDIDGVAIRTGHHCAEPIMRRYKIPATARASFGLYNTKEEIDVLINSINKVNKMFS